MFADADAQSASERKVNYSIHWFRKGAESARAEDKILCYWIAIEHPFENDACISSLVEAKELKAGKIGLVCEVYSAMQIRSRVFQLGWDLRDEFDQTRRMSAPSLPQELAERAQLRAQVGQTMELRKFVECLGEILTHVGRGPLNTDVRRCIQIFGPSAQALPLVKQILEQTTDELLLIYRYRNKIVHNAQFTDPLLPYFARKAENYAGWLVRSALRWAAETPRGTASAEMSRLYSEGKSYLAALENANTVSSIDVLLSLDQ